MILFTRKLSKWHTHASNGAKRKQTHMGCNDRIYVCVNTNRIRNECGGKIEMNEIICICHCTVQSLSARLDAIRNLTCTPVAEALPQPGGPAIPTPPGISDDFGVFCLNTLPPLSPWLPGGFILRGCAETLGPSGVLLFIGGAKCPAPMPGDMNAALVALRTAGGWCEIGIPPMVT